MSFKNEAQILTSVLWGKPKVERNTCSGALPCEWRMCSRRWLKREISSAWRGKEMNRNYFRAPILLNKVFGIFLFHILLKSWIVSMKAGGGGDWGPIVCLRSFLGRSSVCVTGLSSPLPVTWYSPLSFFSRGLLSSSDRGILISLDSKCIFGNFICANVV